MLSTGDLYYIYPDFESIIELLIVDYFCQNDPAGIQYTFQNHSQINPNGNGKTTYRGLVTVSPTAKNVISNVICDALLIDDESRTDTFPYQEIQRDDATITHEASVGKIKDDTLFYLTSRRIPENEALALVVMEFFDVFTRELPMEYAVELNRLIETEMEGSVG